MGPRLGIMFVPHWKTRPRFQITSKNITRPAETDRPSRNRSRILTNCFRLTENHRSRKAAKPKTNRGVSDRKNRLLNEDCPCQSSKLATAYRNRINVINSLTFKFFCFHERKRNPKQDKKISGVQDHKPCSDEKRTFSILGSLKNQGSG